jgi:orotidine-5'-phosphate decarboxylase
MNKTELISLIKKKRSFLCIGLDTDIRLIPKCMLEEEDPVFSFNKKIIDATIEFAVAYKPNLAFYESSGSKGWRSLQKTMDYLGEKQHQIFTIADAKRGDIGNTSKRYAAAFFNRSAGGFNFDAVTVAPYMGEDSVTPFLNFKGKWVVLLALTSNQGAFDFQTLISTAGKPFYQHVIETSLKWGTSENMMYVVGATKSSMLAEIRRIIPGHFLLVPGVGAQGGTLEDVCAAGLNNECGLLVNSSRGIIYASAEDNFQEAAHVAARELQLDMEQQLLKHNIIG